jgi:Asp/Glu/hydantoin racemase
MRHPILVINPNSSAAVTRAIDDAMAPLRIPGGPEIACLTLEEGPPGVESQTDADGVILPLCRVIRELMPMPRPLSSPASAIPACSRPARRPQSQCSGSPNAES